MLCENHCIGHPSGSVNSIYNISVMYVQYIDCGYAFFSQTYPVLNPTQLPAPNLEYQFVVSLSEHYILIVDQFIGQLFIAARI